MPAIRRRSGSGIVTMREIIDFLIVAGAARVAYWRGVGAIRNRPGLKL